jgi:hypothetical protein
MFQLGAQAQVMRGAGGPDRPHHLHNHFLGGVGYLCERSLNVFCLPGRDAIALATTLELHPGMTVLVQDDQP